MTTTRREAGTATNPLAKPMFQLVRKANDLARKGWWLKRQNPNVQRSAHERAERAIGRAVQELWFILTQYQRHVEAGHPCSLVLQEHAHDADRVVLDLVIVFEGPRESEKVASRESEKVASLDSEKVASW